MCGIFGVINPPTNINSNDVVNALNAIKHRGPDDEGYIVGYKNGNSVSARGDDTIEELSELKEINSISLKDSSFIFGHRRLSIIDRSYKGHQPFITSEGYVVVFNGEIYNYIEIRKELEEIGYTFETGSDTEVLVKSYIQWEEGCLSKFNGMWAFALYDPRKKIIFISRDRFGIKPLYYYVNGKTVSFSSEIKALLKLPFVSKKPNISQVKRYLVWGSQEHLSPTLFKGINRLLPATYMIVKLGEGTVKEEKYYDLSPNLSKEIFSKRKLNNYAAELLELFTSAVSLRLRSDVPVGTTLSGGIDSSAVVYTINKLLNSSSIPSIGKRQYTFSSVYPKYPSVDESKWIDIVINDTKANGKKIEPNVEDMNNEIFDVIYHQDEPFDSTSIYAQWSVMKLPRKYGVIVTLDGQGGDELFGGYRQYIPIFLYQNLKRPITFLREFVNISRTNISFHEVIRNFGAALIGSNAEKVLSKKYVKFLFENEEYIPSRTKSRENYRSLNLRLAIDVKEGLPRLLRFADRNSMAHSIESRVPFLDYRLVEFAMRLPSSFKIHNGWNKYISRVAFSNLINKKIAWRKDKQGFPTPEKEWFDKELKLLMEKAFQDSKIIREMGVKKNIEFDLLKKQSFKWRLSNIGLWEKAFHM